MTRTAERQMTVAVAGPGDGAGTYTLGTTPPALPGSIELRLDQGDVFWTFTGALSHPPYPLPDFSQQANDYRL